MTAKILDGKRVAEDIRAEVKENARPLVQRGVVPGLAAVLVGDDPASRLYVASKVKASQEAGLYSESVVLPATTTREELTGKLDELNQRDDIDGILLQLPLPDHLQAIEFLDRIDPAKDVDGFHPVSVGKLVQKRPGPRPCTPAGIMELLRREGIEVKGKRAVVVGRSDVVGKPMATLLLHQNATVTVCHSRTVDLPAVCREGEILVAAIGRAAMIRRDFIRPGAVVVDVGMNRAETEEEVLDFFGPDSKRLEVFRKRGSTLVGDVHPRDAMEVASALTPVPGGVGPLTIAMLLATTLELARARRG
ncbi:MAG TPA: bifunctional methylenetetrahydrofolate dehydrogenase/methenyltetrahydrofolate cyclohydrolase FolD [Vicinamibacteria bacterium]|nr:bifunctional methylenetetrahydrofolate dehydrogenase/methenyltetrahydrofolate cyclohydrolase FolD [Vicinamibacteria bacterium]